MFSEDIDIRWGIHQGAPCSMYIFMIFINGLLKQLQESIPGIKKANKRINCIAYADDITLLASCKADLQLLVDLAHQYSRKWQI